jgi:hypothetical protein
MNNGIKTIHLSVHVGSTRSFDIRADEDEVATGGSSKYSGTGTGSPDTAFLHELLKKIADAYRDNTPLKLCVDGVRIKPDANCT